MESTVAFFKVEMELLQSPCMVRPQVRMPLPLHSGSDADEPPDAPPGLVANSDSDSDDKPLVLAAPAKRKRAEGGITRREGHEQVGQLFGLPTVFGVDNEIEGIEKSKK